MIRNHKPLSKVLCKSKVYCKNSLKGLNYRLFIYVPVVFIYRIHGMSANCYPNQIYTDVRRSRQTLILTDKPPWLMIYERLFDEARRRYMRGGVDACWFIILTMPALCFSAHFEKIMTVQSPVQNYWIWPLKVFSGIQNDERTSRAPFGQRYIFPSRVRNFLSFHIIVAWRWRRSPKCYPCLIMGCFSYKTLRLYLVL